MQTRDCENEIHAELAATDQHAAFNLQSLPVRRWTPGRLRARNFYHSEAEQLNRRYLESCLSVPLLDSSNDCSRESCTALVPAEKAQLKLCRVQPVSNQASRSLAAFCTKKMLLQLKQSMQPSLLPFQQGLIVPALYATSRPLEDKSSSSMLDTPVFEDSFAQVCLVAGRSCTV